MIKLKLINIIIKINNNGNDNNAKFNQIIRLIFAKDTIILYYSLHPRFNFN